MIAKILAAKDSGSIDNLRECFKISKALIFKGIKAEMILNKLFTQVLLKSYYICNVRNIGTIFLTKKKTHKI